MSLRRPDDLSKEMRGFRTRMKKTIGFALPVLLGVLIAQQGTGNLFDVFTHAKRGLVVVQSAHRRRRTLKALQTAGVVAAAAVAERVGERAAEDSAGEDFSVEQV